MIRRALFVSLLFYCAAGRAEIIDRIAAVVESQVVTLSEVNQLVDVRLIARRADEDEDGYRRRVLDFMIAQLLRYRDVQRFGAEDVSKDAIESVLREIVGRFPSEQEFLETLVRVELTLDEVRALIKRQLQVEAYIQERFAPTIFVSLEEIENYYSNLWAPQRESRGLAVPPLDEVREEIRGLVRGDRLSQEIDRWTEQLRSRANVDVFVYR